jgi:ArsR family transcriptional regulator
MVAGDSENEVFRLQAELCACLADIKRLRIIHELGTGPKSVGELADSLGLKQANTSQHLAVLRRTGVVATRREGTTVYYSLSSPRISEACELVRSVIFDNLRRSTSLAGIAT